MDSCMKIRYASILLGNMTSCIQRGITWSDILRIGFDDLLLRSALRDLTELLTPLELGMTNLMVE